MPGDIVTVVLFQAELVILLLQELASLIMLYMVLDGLGNNVTLLEGAYTEVTVNVTWFCVLMAGNGEQGIFAIGNKRTKIQAYIVRSFVVS